MLLDDYIGAQPNYPYRRQVKNILNYSQVARRYQFDASASLRVGELMQNHMDLVVENIEFARAPFPTTYIELDMRALWSGWRPTSPQSSTMDDKVGYLIQHGTVIVFAESEEAAAIATWGFRINQPQLKSLRDFFKKSDEASDIIKQAYVFGGQRTAQGYDKWVFDETTQIVAMPGKPGKWTHSQVAAHYDIIPSYENIPSKILLGAAFLGGGDPIIATAALLLLNQTHESIKQQVIPRSSGIYKGKLKSYREHNIVTIHLTKKQKIGDIIARAERHSPIMHDVEGHWKNFNKHPNCAHHWEPVGYGKTESGGHKHYWCPRCLQRKTWTEAYSRGDALKGVATTEYVVKD